MTDEVRIVATPGGFYMDIGGVVVATGTGGLASARTLLGQSDFRKEIEDWYSEYVHMAGKA